ncbi:MULTISPECIES: phosphoribosylglycinamide formyltransferase [unclassified Cupriavidus]|uniref:phosphoribosylglycinamide formyltransferase n=1 Tax=unclassified Cupriavidus TaxID=2640874 RepID=UPI00048CCD48|nr:MULTISPECIES: phosphoribosylglycinamide formyltransferase [unclassified Cupriavidus]MBP0627966.1 phosphoribosylglycinamide formyltransferase [Cupriavidus sp. AcVe19-1a]
MKKIVILISGRGSNMEAIVRACAGDGWPARVAAVLSNRPDAAGLQFAQQQGIATGVVDHRQFPDRASFDAAMAEAIDAHAPDLVVLAGFMRILTPAFVDRYAGRLLNIHPSLLPCFPGLNTHKQALDAGVKLHGATVHFVTPELDHGPIVIQAALDVLPTDTPESLAERLLGCEHQIYPRAVRWFVEDRLQLQDGVVNVINPAEPQLLMAISAHTPAAGVKA